MYKYYIRSIVVVFLVSLFTTSLYSQNAVTLNFPGVQFNSKLLPQDLAQNQHKQRTLINRLQLKKSSTILSPATLQVTEVLNQDWDSGAWVNTTKSTYTYNSMGSQSVYIRQDWAAGAWLNNSKYEYSYSSSNIMDSYAAYNWKNNSWVGSSKWVYTYNASGQAQILNGFEWDTVSATWQPYMRYTYSYDANGRQVSALGEMYSNGSWSNYYLATNTYDSNGNQILSVIQYWTNGAWVNSYQYISEYDSNNNEVKYTFQMWMGTDWLNYYQYTYSYDSNNKKTEETSYDWNMVGPWTPSSKSFYTYTAEGYTSTITDQIWTLPSGPWVNDTQTAYTFQNGYTQKILNTKWNGSGWDNDSQTLYTYTDIVDVNQQRSLPKEFALFQNYPNPFNPSTIISWSIPNSGNVTLKVYDLLGKEIAVLVDEFKQAGVYYSNFTTENTNLVSGVYFYTLTTSSGFISRKMILLK